VLVIPGSQVVVTADDFGADASINEAVATSLHLGQATHASLIVNMTGFDDACERAHREGLIDRVGLHLNLSEGPAISPRMQDCRRFCEEGRFKFPGRFHGFLPLTPSQGRALGEEIRAQITRARDRGLPVTYLDSHHHVHVEPAVTAGVLSAARAMNIQRVRPARNCGAGHRRLRRVKNAAFNRALSTSGLRKIEYFGAVDDIIWLVARRRPAAIEVMVHPARREDGTMIDGTTLRPLAETLAELQRAVDRANGAGGGS
jgi:hypothetical protein